MGNSERNATGKTSLALKASTADRWLRAENPPMNPGGAFIFLVCGLLASGAVPPTAGPAIENALSHGIPDTQGASPFRPRFSP